MNPDKKSRKMFGLPRREKETKLVHDFLCKHVAKKTPGLLCLSGAPGVGKTAVMFYILDELQSASLPCQYLYVNCMDSNNRNELNAKIIDQLQPQISEKKRRKSNDIATLLTAVSDDHRMLILILDELDQMCSKSDKKILKILFQIALSVNSRLILVGICNTLDTTFQKLYNLPTKPLMPQTYTLSDPCCYILHFPPYDKIDIEAIILATLQSEKTSKVLGNDARKLLAAKVAACNGDIRRALNVARSALETYDENSFSESSQKENLNQKEVNVMAVSGILFRKHKEKEIPLQHQAVLFALNKIYLSDKTIGCKEGLPFNSLYREYVKLSEAKGFVCLDKAEIRNICEILHESEYINLVFNSTTLGRKKVRNSTHATDFKIFFDPLIIKDFVLTSAICN